MGSLDSSGEFFCCFKTSCEADIDGDGLLSVDPRIGGIGAMSCSWESKGNPPNPGNKAVLEGFLSIIVP